MTAFELCGINGDAEFTIGKSKIVWQAVSYRDGCDKCIVSRIVPGQTGRPFMLGINYRMRYIDPDTEINVLSK